VLPASATTTTTPPSLTQPDSARPASWPSIRQPEGLHRLRTAYLLDLRASDQLNTACSTTVAVDQPAPLSTMDVTWRSPPHDITVRKKRLPHQEEHVCQRTALPSLMRRDRTMFVRAGVSSQRLADASPDGDTIYAISRTGKNKRRRPLPSCSSVDGQAKHCLASPMPTFRRDHRLH